MPDATQQTSSPKAPRSETSRSYAPPEARARASVAAHGTTLRYAEVEQYGARYRLLRLGSCDFDFDVARALLHAPEAAEAEAAVQAKAAQHAETVAEALRDVFAGATAAVVSFVLHSPDCTSFCTPLLPDEGEAERRQRLRREAALLMHTGDDGARGDDDLDGNDLHVAADALSASSPSGDREPERWAQEGEPEAWTSVLAMPQRTRDHLDQTLQVLPDAHPRVALSTRSAARIMERLSQKNDETESRPLSDAASDDGASREAYDLAVGWYGTHTEYALCRGGRWRFGTHAPAGPPADGAYFAAAVLDHLSVAPAALRHLYVYGQEVSLEAFAPFQAALGLRPERLDPLALIDLDPGSLAPEFDAGAYVPCVGAAL